MATATELFEKLCDAWGVTISPVHADGEFKFRRTLSYKGEVLDVRWSPEVLQDLKQFKGCDAEEEVVRAVVDQLIAALVKFDQDHPS